MKAGGKRDRRTAGCAALLAAAIAFPAGLLVGRGGGTEDRKVAGPGRAAPAGAADLTSRNLYSPRVASDPYVIAEQREVLRALEVACSQLKRHCAEAEQARLRIEEAGR